VLLKNFFTADHFFEFIAVLRNVKQNHHPKKTTALKKNMIYEIVPAGMEKHRSWRDGED